MHLIFLCHATDHTLTQQGLHYSYPQQMLLNKKGTFPVIHIWRMTCFVIQLLSDRYQSLHISQLCWTKFCSNHTVRIWMKTKCDFNRFAFQRKSLMKRAQGTDIIYIAIPNTNNLNGPSHPPEQQLDNSSCTHQLVLVIVFISLRPLGTIECPQLLMFLIVICMPDTH